MNVTWWCKQVFVEKIRFQTENCLTFNILLVLQTPATVLSWLTSERGRGLMCVDRILISVTVSLDTRHSSRGLLSGHSWQILLPGKHTFSLVELLQQELLLVERKVTCSCLGGPVVIPGGCFVIKYRNRVSVSQYIRNCKQLSPQRPDLQERKQ